MHAVDPSSGEVVSSFLTDRRFRDVLWTPDGRALLFDAGASVWRYDIPSGSYTEIHRHGAGVFRVALSPDGSQIAFAEVSGERNLDGPVRGRQRPRSVQGHGRRDTRRLGTGRAMARLCS